VGHARVCTDLKESLVFDWICVGNLFVQVIVENELDCDLDELWYDDGIRCGYLKLAPI
jgi:hypothetical protein